MNIENWKKVVLLFKQDIIESVKDISEEISNADNYWENDDHWTGNKIHLTNDFWTEYKIRNLLDVDVNIRGNKGNACIDVYPVVNGQTDGTVWVNLQYPMGI